MEKERLKFCIERYDHYYDSINNKSTVFLALGTFSVGGLVASYPYLYEHFDCNLFIYLFLFSAMSLGLISLIVVLIVSIPYMKKNSISLYYFRSIAKREKNAFKRESQNLTDEAELDDLREQVYGLAKGLNRKFLFLRIAGILFTLMFIVLIPLFIYLISNIK